MREREREIKRRRHRYHKRKKLRLKLGAASEADQQRIEAKIRKTYPSYKPAVWRCDRAATRKIGRAAKQVFGGLPCCSPFLSL